MYGLPLMLRVRYHESHIDVESMEQMISHVLIDTYFLDLFFQRDSILSQYME